MKRIYVKLIILLFIFNFQTATAQDDYTIAFDKYIYANIWIYPSEKGLWPINLEVLYKDIPTFKERGSVRSFIEDQFVMGGEFMPYPGLGAFESVLKLMCGNHYDWSLRNNIHYSLYISNLMHRKLNEHNAIYRILLQDGSKVSISVKKITGLFFHTKAYRDEFNQSSSYEIDLYNYPIVDHITFPLAIYEYKNVKLKLKGQIKDPMAASTVAAEQLKSAHIISPEISTQIDSDADK